MSFTTLVAFLLQTAPSTRTVELLGSWDNFSRPYRLERDLRMGRGHWRGCHSFKDITCDGDTERSVQRRNGGLRMGGTYWYFYRLDGEVEVFNIAEPSTTFCPFLPGQEVNLLEVPTEAGAPKNSLPITLSSSTESTVFTLDPEQKYLALKPSVRKPTSTERGSILPKHPLAPTCAQVSNLRNDHSDHGAGASQGFPMILPESSREKVEPRPTSSGLVKESALMAVFHRMRGIRSAEYSRDGREARSFVYSRGKLSKPVATKQKSFERAVKNTRDAKSASASHGSLSTPTTLLARLLTPKPPIPASDETRFDIPQRPPMPSKHGVPPNSPVGCSCRIADRLPAGSQLQPNKRSASPGATPAIAIVSNASTSQAVGSLDNRIAQSLHDQNYESSSEWTSNERGTNEHMRQPSSIVSFDRVFSESLEHSSMHAGPLLPPCFSGSDSASWPFAHGPHRSLDHDLDHDDAISSDVDVRAPKGGEARISRRIAAQDESFPQDCLAGYNLPLAEQASAMKIKLPQATTSQPDLSASSLLRSAAHPHHVQVWGDETEHHFTALEELVYDLGYLGDAII